MNHYLEILIGAVVAWIVLLEMRFKSAKNKIVKMELENKDAKIANDMRLLSDDKLDAILAKDLSTNESEH